MAIENRWGIPLVNTAAGIAVISRGRAESDAPARMS
jgi:hypothetical protein